MADSERGEFCSKCHGETFRSFKHERERGSKICLKRNRLGYCEDTDLSVLNNEIRVNAEAVIETLIGGISGGLSRVGMQT